VPSVLCCVDGPGVRAWGPSPEQQKLAAQGRARGTGRAGRGPRAPDWLAQSACTRRSMRRPPRQLPPRPARARLQDADTSIKCISMDTWRSAGLPEFLVAGADSEWRPRAGSKWQPCAGGASTGALLQGPPSLAGSRGPSGCVCLAPRRTAVRVAHRGAGAGAGAGGGRRRRGAGGAAGVQRARVLARLRDQPAGGRAGQWQGLVGQGVCAGA
jgi:hypothetical protein